MPELSSRTRRPLVRLVAGVLVLLAAEGTAWALSAQPSGVIEILLVIGTYAGGIGAGMLLAPLVADAARRRLSEAVAAGLGLAAAVAVGLLVVAPVLAGAELGRAAMLLHPLLPLTAVLLLSGAIRLVDALGTSSPSPTPAPRAAPPAAGWRVSDGGYAIDLRAVPLSMAQLAALIVACAVAGGSIGGGGAILLALTTGIELGLNPLIYLLETIGTAIAGALTFWFGLRARRYRVRIDRTAIQVDGDTRHDHFPWGTVEGLTVRTDSDYARIVVRGAGSPRLSLIAGVVRGPEQGIGPLPSALRNLIASRGFDERRAPGRAPGLHRFRSGEREPVDGSATRAPARR